MHPMHVSVQGFTASAVFGCHLLYRIAVHHLVAADALVPDSMCFLHRDMYIFLSWISYSGHNA